MLSPSANDPTSPGEAREFNTTHWTMVTLAADSQGPEAGDALNRLCAIYWKPLFCYVRCRGYPEEEARDLTQGFFARFLEKKSLRLADPARGRFRSFLLSSFQNFLISEWDKARAERRGGSLAFLSWDSITEDDSYPFAPVADSEAETVYDRNWAVTSIQVALARLREEHVAAGKTANFEELKRFLSTEAAEDDYANAGARLGMSPNAVTVAVHRLRIRYAELVREVVAQSVAKATEVDDEVRYLVGLLAG